MTVYWMALALHTSPSHARVDTDPAGVKLKSKLTFRTIIRRFITDRFLIFQILGKTDNLTSIKHLRDKVRIRNAVTEKLKQIVNKELFATVFYMFSNMILRSIGLR